MKILVIGGIAQSLVNFRGPLLREMIAKGHEVRACSGESCEHITETLQSWGVEYTPIHLSRAGISVFEDLHSVWELFWLMNKFRPDVVLSYTIKPVVWGGLAARLCGVRRIYSMIEGLGYAFMPIESFTHRLASYSARVLYRISLSGSTGVFFLNPDDVQVFIENNYVTKEQSHLLNGIGVDLDYYQDKENSEKSGACQFLMIARLLKDKGVREYIQTVTRMRKQGCMLSFAYAGALDSNPSSISGEELERWCSEGIIEYLGELNDVRPAYSDCNVYVLPSYREGTPRTVLEAMAMGRPIITTDVPGCRETVLLTEAGRKQKAHGEAVMEGENGYLVKVKDVDALQLAMEKFIHDTELIVRMGQRSREIAEEKYDVHKVNRVILEVMGL